MQGIYCIENIKSGRKYYGSSMAVDRRLKQHLTDLQKQKHHNLQLQRSFNKHSQSAFIFQLVEETAFSSRKDLLIHEQTYLDKNIGGYNMAPANGGDTISNHPNKIQIIENLRQQTLLRNQNLTASERKEKYGVSGDQNGMFGKTHSEDVKSVLRGLMIGNTRAAGAVRTEEYKLNVSNRMKGKYLGEDNPFYGKYHTVESKKKISDANSGDNSWIKNIDPALLPYTKRYSITYPSGEIKEVSGLKAIAIEFNVSIENVHATIKRINQGKIPVRGVFANTIIKQIS